MAWLVWLACLPVAATAVTVEPGRASQVLAEGIATAPETARNLAPPAAAFRPLGSTPAYFGSGAGANWLKLTLVNPGPHPIERILAVRFPYLDSVELHARLADGRAVRGAAGARLAVSETLAPFPAFRLDLPPGESTVLLRLESAGVAIAPLELYAPAAFHRVVLRDHMVIGAVLGAGLVLALYLSLLAGGPRDDRHAAFLALTLAALGHVLVTTGIGKVWLWPDTHVPSLGLVFLTQGLVLGTGAWFFRTVLRAGGLPAAVDRALMLASVLGFVAALSPLLPGGVARFLHFVAAGAGPAGLFLLALVLALAGRKEAGVLALGWGPAQAVTVHWYLRAHEVTGYHPASHYLALVAFAALIGVYARDLAQEAQSAAVAAERDPLTGLGNRTRMERAYRSLATVRKPDCVAVLQIDLDRFKALNDTLGHAAGDEALVEVSERFRAALRAEDVLCRIGGDEFVAVLAHYGDPAALAAIAERLLAAVRVPVRTTAGDWTLGASIGIAASDGSVGLAALQCEADAALYRVKQGGRNGYRFAEPAAVAAV